MNKAIPTKRFQGKFNKTSIIKKFRAPSTSAQLKQLEKNAEKDEDEYLRDVEAATGVNLRNPGEKSRRIIAKKREKSEKEKSRDRLKVFILIFKV